MNKKMMLLFLVFVSMFSQNIIAEIYEVPPSRSTSLSVPWISDSAMEYCVKVYNKAKWLKEEMDYTQVNSYSHVSVNNYNEKVHKHGKMINYFNGNCAGKQSESAYKAAQKLNQDAKKAVK